MEIEPRNTRDLDEWKQSQEWPHGSDVFAAFGKVVFGDALRMLQNLEPHIVPMFSAETNTGGEKRI
jgi:hypothetical protein